VAKLTVTRRKMPKGIVIKGIVTKDSGKGTETQQQKGHSVRYLNPLYRRLNGEGYHV